MAPPPLQEHEKVRVRYFLGYPASSASNASMSVGLPAYRETSFLIENAMNAVAEHALPTVRSLLTTLEGLEQQLLKATCVLPVDAVGTIRLAGSASTTARAGNGGLATDRLDAEVNRWRGRLADVLGVPLYHFSSRMQGGSVRNVRVRR